MNLTRSATALFLALGLSLSPAVLADEYLLDDQHTSIVFATNHLGHFAMFQQLRQLLVESQGRVVTVASMVHKQARLNLDRVALADPTASTRDLYNTSKLCNILFSYEVHKRYNQFVTSWNSTFFDLLIDFLCSALELSRTVSALG